MNPLFVLVLQVAQEAGAVAATHEATKTPQWYEQVTGIIAIPAAAIGVAYAYLLIKKTRLESRKTELEIAAQERALALEPQPSAQERALAGADVSVSILRNRTYYFLILRYVVLELLLRIYNALTAPISWASNLLSVGISLMPFGGMGLLNIGALITGVNVLVNIITTIGYWMIFFALGWPLFKDTNRALGIDLSEYRPERLLRAVRRSNN